MGASFSASIQTSPGAHSASYAMGSGSFLRVKLPGIGAGHPPHLMLRLRKEYSYTSTSPLGLHGLFKDELLEASMHVKIVVYSDTKLTSAQIFKSL